MADAGRLVTARALGDARVRQAEDRLGSPAEAVGDNEPLRVFGADGRAALFYNSGYYGREQLYLKVGLTRSATP